MVRAESLGYAPYLFLTRDCSLSPEGVGDGFHTQEELRQVIQNDVDAYERSSKDTLKWNQLQQSRRMLNAMTQADVSAVDYLPEILSNAIDDELRPRAVELLNIAHEISDGRIDQSVVDYLRRRYETKYDQGKILGAQKAKIMEEIKELAKHLALQ